MNADVDLRDRGLERARRLSLERARAGAARCAAGAKRELVRRGRVARCTEGSPEGAPDASNESPFLGQLRAVVRSLREARRLRVREVRRGGWPAWRVELPLTRYLAGNPGGVSPSLARPADRCRRSRLQISAAGRWAAPRAGGQRDAGSLAAPRRARRARDFSSPIPSGHRATPP